eukprot:1157203-Pelagomonas_calceolata.AAC.2
MDTYNPVVSSTKPQNHVHVFPSEGVCGLFSFHQKLAEPLLLRSTCNPRAHWKRSRSLKEGGRDLEHLQGVCGVPRAVQWQRAALVSARKKMVLALL